MIEMARRRHSQAVHIRLTEAEVALLDEAAADLGVTRAALLRMMIRNARFLAVSVPPVSREESDGDRDAAIRS